MIYLLDADTLIFMIRRLKSSNRHQASRERAQKLVDRCRQAQAEGDTLAVSAITVAELEFGAGHFCFAEFVPAGTPEKTPSASCGW